MDRRTLIRTMSIAALAAPMLATRALASDMSPLAIAAREAWIFGLPLIENARTRKEVMDAGTKPNALLHMRILTTPKNQFVVTPNNDTLYSRSWIDLAKGPVRVTLPSTGERYLSVAFMDMYSNNFAVLGTRTTGGDGGTFTVVGPDHATRDPLAIRSPTRWTWMLIRLLIDGDADLPAAHALQDRFRVRGPAAAVPTRRYAERSAPWAEYFQSVQELMVENSPRATDDRLLDTIAPLGLTARGGFDARRFTPSQVLDIELGVAAAKAMLATTRRQGPVVDGWVYPKANLGDFGQDYFYRAQVAVAGLAALPRVEAMYMRPLNPAGRIAFDSSSNWVLDIPADKLPPVNGFWSLSMYKATPDGGYYFFDNPIDRYAIGDRTPALVRDSTGGISIWIARTDPGPARRANWLPSPPDGPFGLVFRAYLPKDALLDGEYHLPRLRPA